MHTKSITIQIVFLLIVILSPDLFTPAILLLRQMNYNNLQGYCMLAAINSATSIT